MSKEEEEDCKIKLNKNFTNDLFWTKWKQILKWDLEILKNDEHQS